MILYKEFHNVFFETENLTKIHMKRGEVVNFKHNHLRSYENKEHYIKFSLSRTVKISLFEFYFINIAEDNSLKICL